MSTWPALGIRTMIRTLLGDTGMKVNGYMVTVGITYIPGRHNVKRSLSTLSALDISKFWQT
jgi:hypothetical protein